MCRARLVQGPDGSFYGTTEQGGAYGVNSYGTVFKINSTGTFSNLLSFTGTGGAYPGANPVAGLIWGADGNLYGTTQYGGTSNNGTVFGLTTNGVFTSLVSFSGTNGAYIGANPAAGLVWGTNGGLGALYGTTEFGGTNDVVNGGDGTIFVVTTNSLFTNLVSFTGTNGLFLGANPVGDLVREPTDRSMARPGMAARMTWPITVMAKSSDCYPAVFSGRSILSTRSMAPALRPD